MRNKLTAAAALAGGLCVVSGSAFAAPPSYPLLCRGGASMRIVVNHDVDGNGIPGGTHMNIYFTPAVQPGSVAEPGPGECVWLDRTFRPGEPSVMWIRSPNIEFALQVTGDGCVVVDGSGLRLNVEGTQWSAEANDWQYLVCGVMRGELFTAHVYNESGSVMVITRVRP